MTNIDSLLCSNEVMFFNISPVLSPVKMCSNVDFKTPLSDRSSNLCLSLSSFDEARKWYRAADNIVFWALLLVSPFKSNLQSFFCLSSQFPLQLSNKYPYCSSPTWDRLHRGQFRKNDRIRLPLAHLAYSNQHSII